MNAIAKPALTAAELAKIRMPFSYRTFVKSQPKGDREFSCRGPKIDIALKYLIDGGYTRAEIARLVPCSVSRVAEASWALDDYKRGRREGA